MNVKTIVVSIEECRNYLRKTNIGEGFVPNPPADLTKIPPRLAQLPESATQARNFARGARFFGLTATLGFSHNCPKTITGPTPAHPRSNSCRVKKG